MAEDREKVKALLTEAITVLCKNGLQYISEFTVEGLLGITLDQEEVFLININERIKSETASAGTVKSAGISTGAAVTKGPAGRAPVKPRKRPASQPSQASTEPVAKKDRADEPVIDLDDDSTGILHAHMSVRPLLQSKVIKRLQEPFFYDSYFIF